MKTKLLNKLSINLILICFTVTCIFTENQVFDKSYHAALQQSVVEKVRIFLPEITCSISNSRYMNYFNNKYNIESFTIVFDKQEALRKTKLLTNANPVGINTYVII